MSTRHRSITGSPLERHRTVRGHDFYPPAEVLARIPGLYRTEPVPTGEKTIWLHYFAGPCDWWIAEYDPASGDACGYACLGDPGNAEWGYTNLADLEALHSPGGITPGQTPGTVRLLPPAAGRTRPRLDPPHRHHRRPAPRPAPARLTSRRLCHDNHHCSH